MPVKKKLFSVFFIGWCFALLSGWMAVCCSEAVSMENKGIEALSGESIILKSLYTAMGEGGESAGQRDVCWVVLIEKGEGLRLNRLFYRGSGKRMATGDSAVCKISFFFGEDEEKICFQTATRNDICADGGELLVVPGFPAPCDVLPVQSDSTGKVFVNRSEAGGRVFEWRYRIEKKFITAAEAVSAGYVDTSVSIPEKTELVMVQAVDASGKTVVRQLWPENGDWWIYEETADRRSWRVSP